MTCDPDAVIKDAIVSVLPVISGETVSLIVEKLKSLGVEKKEDLKFVREEDIVELIRPIQCRKLLNAWKTEGKKCLTFSFRQMCKYWDSEVINGILYLYPENVFLRVQNEYVANAQNVTFISPVAQVNGSKRLLFWFGTSLPYAGEYIGVQGALPL